MDRTQLNLDEGVFNSNDMLEMSNHLKELYEKNKIKTNVYIRKYNDMVENMTIIFGLVKVLESTNGEMIFDFCIEEITDICNSLLFNHLEEEL
tara:strand:- start:203 stop:481 length:279 start_codon:yes stop_codon:yes gene_type:complete